MQRHFIYLVLASLAIPPAHAARSAEDPLKKGVDPMITGRQAPVVPRKTPELVGAPIPGSTDLEPDANDLQLHPKTFSPYDQNGNARPLLLRPSMLRAPMPRAEDTASPAATASNIKLYASGNYRLRAGPWGKVQMIIPRNAAFEVIGRTGDWYVVKYKGKTGYVHKDGITHPLAAALMAETGFGDLTRAQAAEMAACVESTQASPIASDFKDFLQTIQSRLHGASATELSTNAPLPPARPARFPAEVTSAPKKLATTLPPSRSQARPGRTVDPDDVFMKRPTIQKLAAEARKAARKYRPYAKHVCKRMKRSYPCGGHANPHKSKGWCKAGVREAMQRTFGFTLPGNSAIESRDFLQTRMAKVAVDSCKEAPVGSICLYDTPLHEFGHVEIKAGNNEYCSDFCAARPIRGSYRLLGVYYPAKE